MSPAPDLDLAATFPVPPDRLWAAWVNGPTHAAMTGAAAASDPKVGGAFTAWDGYISGTWTALEPGRSLGMDWRTTQFPAGAPAARIVVDFAAAPAGGTAVRLRQWQTPPDQIEGYRAGWEEYYFAPMRKHFGP